MEQTQIVYDTARDAYERALEDYFQIIQMYPEGSPEYQKAEHDRKKSWSVFESVIIAYENALESYAKAK